MTVVINLASATAKSSAKSNGRLVKSYTHVYLYRTDSPIRPSFADIASDIGIAPGSPYTENLSAVAGEAQIDHLMSCPPFCRAEVTVNWSTETTPPEEDSTDPTTQRPVWRLRPSSIQTYIMNDRDDNPILHTNKCAVDGGIPADVTVGTAEIALNILDEDFPYDSVMKHSGKVNSEEFLGAAPGNLKLTMTAEEDWEGDVHFWKVTYEFAYNPQGHQPKFVSTGFQHIKAGELTPITFSDLQLAPNGNETKVPEPEPLDSDGLVVPYVSRPSGVAIVTVNAYSELDFATLPGMS